MRALRTTLLAAGLLAALLVPAATADPVVPTTCVEQELGPATLTTCTPALPQCVVVGFGDGGMLSLCFHEHESPPDLDGDGFTEAQGDCDDQDPSVFPGASEAPNGVDDDCDGVVDEDMAGPDRDDDGFTASQGDCDDDNPFVNPGMPEAANGIDDDCDGQVDEGFEDMDSDGFAMPEDCDDNDSGVNPTRSEVPDRRDNDCDGTADGEFADNGDFDGDGVTLQDGDCNDNDGNTFPGASEIADRRDNDCNGLAEA